MMTEAVPNFFVNMWATVCSLHDFDACTNHMSISINTHQSSGNRSLCWPFAIIIAFGGLPLAGIVNMEEFECVFHEKAIAQGQQLYSKKAKKGSIVSVGRRPLKAKNKSKSKVAATRSGKGKLNPRNFWQQVTKRYCNH